MQGPVDKYGTWPEVVVENRRVVPDWCAVKFPNRVYLYNDLPRANIGRIWARAMFNLRTKCGYTKKFTGWSRLAHEIGLFPPPPTTRQIKKNLFVEELIKANLRETLTHRGNGRYNPYNPVHPFKCWHDQKLLSKREKGLRRKWWRSFYPNSTGMEVMRHAVRGKLPEDPVIRQKLFDIAGYPWE